MSKETKKKIAEVIERLNYRPSKQAQALKSKHSYLIGIVVADISNMFSSLLLKGIGEVLERSGYQMIIVDAANSVTQEKELLEKLLDQSVEAIILQPSSRQSENYDFISERGIPLLLVDRQTEPQKWSAVLTNNHEATEDMLEKALAKGYEEVVVISEPVKNVSTREVRYQTAEEVVLRSGKSFQLIEIDEDNQIDEALKKLGLGDKKRLLFASNGRMLMETLAFLIREEVRLPDEVGVTGFDDWSLTALVGPGITSIEQPSREIGKAVGRQLLQKLSTDEKEIKEIIVPSQIRWRKSV